MPPPSVVFGRGDEQLRHVGHAAQRRHADFGAVGVDGHRAPAEDFQPFVGGDGLDVFARGGAGDGILRQEADAGGEGVGAVAARRGKFEVDDLAEQFDGQLDAGCLRRHRCWVRRPRRRGVRGVPER